MTEPYDVTIVGGGVVGAAVAWRLSLDHARVLWLEANHDVAEGTSKANSAITASGYDTTPGTLESQLVRASSQRWERITDELGVSFARVGSLALAFDQAEVHKLSELLAQAHANDVSAEIVDGDAARELAPAASPAALAALHVPGEGIIDSIRLVIAYAERAVRNGVTLLTSTPLLGVQRDREGRIATVRTPAGEFTTRSMVNAAGLRADQVSDLAGGERFQIWPRRGQFLLVDREIGREVNMILTSIPTEHTRGVLAIPTTNRSLLLGPTAEDRDDKDDRGTDHDSLQAVLSQAQRLLPTIDSGHVLKSFAGLRPASERTYRVEISGTVSNLVQAVAIRSTGVSSSPALADHVRELLIEVGVDLRARPDAPRRLPRHPRLAETPTAALDGAVMGPDPQRRQIVCACEHVTAAEIRDALDMAVPATSLDGVRKRTRASGGRCQGSYCLAGISFMLSLHRDLTPAQTPQAGAGTQVGIADVPPPPPHPRARANTRRPQAWSHGEGSHDALPTVAIAGAGAAGLACAAALAGRARAVLVERLPVAGGEHWREPTVAALVDDARDSGAQLLAGATGVRWNGRQLTALAHDAVHSLSAGALVVATGHRPCTRGELHLTGDRSAGVLPAPVALHLLAHGVLLGRHPIVIGGGDWARDIAVRTLALGATKVTVIAPSGIAVDGLEEQNEPRLRVHNHAKPLATVGMPRVTAVDVQPTGGGTTTRLGCDAVILAEGRVPWRNIDGAVFGGPAVVFAQVSGNVHDDERSAQRGADAALDALRAIAAGPTGSPQEPSTRIGGPDASVLTRR